MQKKQRIVMYVPSGNAAGKRLLQAVLPHVENARVEVFRSVEQLSSYYRNPLFEDTISVFLPADHQDLSELLSISHMVRDTATIMVLPDLNQNSISKAHALGARFLSFADSDFTDVMAALDRMLSR